MLPSLFSKFFADFVRIFKALPKCLQRTTRRVFACVVLQAVLEIGSIAAISFLAVSITAPERILTHPAAANLLSHFPQLQGLTADPRQFALLIAVLAAGLIAAKNAISAFVNYKTNQLGERISLFAGKTVFQHFLYSPYIQHLAGDSSAMFQALSWRDQLGRMVIHLMAVYSYAAIALAMALALVIATPGIILLVMAVIIGLAVAIYRRLRGSMDQAGLEAAEWAREQNKVTMNAMHGVREMLIYRQQDVFFKNFEKACKEGIPYRTFLSIAPSAPTWILETAGFLSIVVTLWIMLTFLDSSMVHITAVLTMIMLIAWRVLPLLNRSLGALVVVRGTRHAALDCLDKVEEALQHPVSSLPDPSPTFVLRRSISFEHVFFRYPTAEADCLSDISFSITCGSKIGIIGQSGAGKSSIASILSGLIEPTEGEMLVDGRTMSPADRAAYCIRVGYVPQNPYILPGTLAENVAFSQWGKPWDEEKVLRACRMAELDIVEQRGINFTLGQGGGGLSGGQAQRLSIARALYAEPSVLILDEATSALDGGVESAIMNTIFSLPQSITTITIAHRLTTVERCDTLIWIDGGKIQRIGSPKKILVDYKKSLEQRALLQHEL